jgi:type I restriction enzyme S subunit
MKQGWEIKTIGDVCKVIAGQSPEGKFYNDIGNGLPFYQGKKEYGEKYIGKPTTWTTKVTKEAEANDILMSVRAPVGPINFANQKICIGRGLAAIRATKLIDKEFLFNFLMKHESEIVGNTGAVFNSINKAQIEAIQIPLPPLPEQKRIVAILDETFAAIAKAKANAEQNLKNAKELFESYLQGVFENKGEGWEEKTLIEVCELKPQKKEARDKLNGTDLVTFLPMEDLGVLNKEIIGVKERQLKDVAGSYTYFADNDVLLAKITPCFENGKIGIARNLINGVGFGSSEYIVFRTQGSIEPEYLYYFLSRNQIRDEGRKYMSGAVGHKRVSKDWIENYLISFPNLIKEQQNIVQKLDALSNETKKLEAIYNQKINDLEELKKSVLQKAFSSELKTAKALV